MAGAFFMSKLQAWATIARLFGRMQTVSKPTLSFISLPIDNN
ncbi:hypothetical protein CTS44_07850 [Comamonas thiooxydans]|nr:hypothetical protein CTS44_07850 [Comamonas thiooxydans]